MRTGNLLVRGLSGGCGTKHLKAKKKKTIPEEVQEPSLQGQGTRHACMASTFQDSSWASPHKHLLQGPRALDWVSFNGRGSVTERCLGQDPCPHTEPSYLGQHRPGELPCSLPTWVRRHKEPSRGAAKGQGHSSPRGSVPACTVGEEQEG